MRPFKRPLLALATGAALGLLPATAMAQEATPTLSRWVFRAELGAGTMLTDFVQNPSSPTMTGLMGARISYRFFEPLSIQGGAGFGRFFRSGYEDSGFFSATLGLRLEPQLGSFARIWLDGNAGLNAVGNADRFGVDGGVGIEFFASRRIAVGPFGRVTHSLNGRDGVGQRNAPDWTAGDTTFWTAGLTLAVYSFVDPPAAPPRPPPPPDTDHDGVNDSEDVCPTVPAGDHPNPARPGCALTDDDHDDVWGDTDQCPTDAAGEHPDPARAGCPLPDDDHDGVFGTDDQCPTEAAGEHPNPDRHGCPDGDGDHDGVLDHGDVCPTEAAGIHPDAARAGCPAPDRDHDNIPDATDHCPDQPGAPSSNPTRNGCPGLVVLDSGVLRILRPVNFAPNRDAILPSSTALMNSVADALRSIPEIRRVSIEGHTDDVGDDAANMDLSRRRAASVLRWLVTNGHIEAGRLVSEGFGETRPVAPGTTPAIRAQNRRVEFRIVEIAH